ncbi:MAG: M18 family aminopeptidase [Clostridium sp.]|nr:M18 family aminopeptidase [Clostridium sp.]
MNINSLANELLDFINESPSAFITVKNIKHNLLKNRFIELDAGDRWELQKEGKYFIIQNDSSIIAFTVGKGIIAKKGFKLIGCHSDCPSFKIKPSPEMNFENKCVKLNTEVYGSPILNTWLDRPLSLSGRVTIKGKDAFSPITKLVNIKKPLLIIPNLAIHMNRNVNKGVELNRQIDLLPILGLINDNFEKDNFLIKFLAKDLNVEEKDILDFDLYLHEFEKGCIMGLNDELISSSRLDDLEMVHAALTAFLDSTACDSTNVLVCFDNEEIGSRTKQGADSEFLSTVLERIVTSFGGDREDYFRSIYKSFMISADVTHAVHPNKSEKCDPTNRPFLGGGPVIKSSSQQKYSSDSTSCAVYSALCKNCDIPFQRFVNRSDEIGGSTIGPIISGHVNFKSVDVGTPLLAMHSIRELCSVVDHYYVTKSFSEFYK